MEVTINDAWPITYITYCIAVCKDWIVVLDIRQHLGYVCVCVCMAYYYFSFLTMSTSTCLSRFFFLHLLVPEANLWAC